MSDGIEGFGDGRVIARIEPRLPRRLLAVGIQGTLAVLLLLLAAAMPEGAFLFALCLGLAGLAAGIGTLRLWQASSLGLVLTASDLRDGSGRLVAAVDAIAAVDRSAFAFKPASGFLLRLSTAGDSAWVPGLWWRIGRRVGVGGVTPRHEGKAMAEAIALLIAQREARGRAAGR